MYSVAFLMLLALPPALGSLWGLAVVAAMLPFFMWRIADEEKLLTAELHGYAEYCRKIRFRLIPGIY